MKKASLAKYLKYEIFPRQENQFPLPWTDIFGRSAPLYVEIGFGNGVFLINWAREQPEGNFIGIEISLESMAKAQKGIFQEGITNIRVIHEDARFALREFFADNSIRHIMMNFPDPWPKERHRERRALSPAFVQILGTVLESDGIFELVTDQEWYAQDAQELCQQFAFLAVEKVEKNPHRPVQTKYEKKWRQLGRDIFRLVARKVQPTTVERIIEGGEMPHVFIPDIPITFEHIQSLENMQGEGPNQFFIIKESYATPDGQKFLLLTITRDFDYQQKFYITVVARQNGWIAKLESTTQPYRTAAVKMAVQAVGQKLLSRNNEAIK
ncbi:MAG: tRNA (guanosine(46)-N7)-methyltransferase TrmB [Calditrichaeota bacterium]|nr:tRNA (guanosine(46)-N7)-methyltransferase TrmB [Calditrichota bacterium]